MSIQNGAFIKTHNRIPESNLKKMSKLFFPIRNFLQKGILSIGGIIYASGQRFLKPSRNFVHRVRMFLAMRSPHAK